VAEPPWKARGPHGDLQFSIGEREFIERERRKRERERERKRRERKRKLGEAPARARKDLGEKNSKRFPLLLNSKKKHPPKPQTAPGSAFEIFSVETVFSSAPDAKNSTSSTSAWVVDVKPSSAERLGADIDFLLSPARVANAPACDSVVVGALRSGLEMQLRRREREQAREAGACDENEGKTTKNSSSFSSPKVWSSAGDPCSHLEDEEAWEVEQAAALGWKRLDLEGSSAPKSLLDRSPEAMAAAGKPKRKTPRDAASIQAAAEALARAVNGDVKG